jgi:RanBP-type and C3HC4-type zinc finger-containing protein 1
VKVKKNAEINGTQKNDSESDDEPQNEKVGAVGGVKAVKTAIEDKGWECPLCTLINLPNRSECLACSTYRPKLTVKETPKLKDIAYHLRVNEDLRTFFEMDKVDLRPKQVERNDLDRNSGCRKSSDIFNILVEDKEIVQTLNPIVMTASIANPNITKNKYRGVENFNPFNKSYLFPKTEANDIRKPVITNVIYKSTNQNATKDLSSNRKSHYQELVNLEISDIVPNSEVFECSICFLKVQPKGGVCLRDCLHTFCRICLENHIKYSEEAEVKCPFIDDVYSCQSLLQDREIRGLVSKDEFEKHLSLSIRLAENKIENAFHCKTPNCKGWCIFEDTTNSFKCPVCTIVNCITCGVSHFKSFMACNFFKIFPRLFTMD